MSVYVQELNNMVANLNEKQINVVLDFVKDMMSKKNVNETINIYRYKYPFYDGGGVEIGLFKNENLLNENYDFDECNDEIAEMFGV